MKEKNRKSFAYIVLTLVIDICLIFGTVLITGAIFINFNPSYFIWGFVALFIVAIGKYLIKDEYFKKN